MTARTIQWAAKPESADERDSRVPPLPTEFLIANLELESRLTYRKPSPLKISNRKYFAIFYPAATRPAASNRTQWHRHSCLCAVAKPRTQRTANAAPSLSVRSQNSNRDTAIRILANLPDCTSFQISNRDKTWVLRPPWRKALFAFQKKRSQRSQRYPQPAPQIDGVSNRALVAGTPGVVGASDVWGRDRVCVACRLRAILWT
jgi:hypothetical protein